MLPTCEPFDEALSPPPALPPLSPPPALPPGHFLAQLSDLFNLTLGEKLIQHIRKWLDPEALIKPVPVGVGAS